uniref:thioredoxin-dependent peroxiredoxin n=1 Tax=Fibrocapsa japonica TaxID=94617 RepID=A0A7S2V5C5_9STRA|mmetsp:Transcript_8100/g.12411  ORF Transcript_8100/g.12411 Transcript_8100/m.12411 type:complete len:196 (+) Transcript_8100:80-667(+)|eukprot:CAMPEP_0113943566 /NCGR_PEP_ID=MMETSP1339-20121228/26116_1 /TAXON_ID=94617 /ORGANISM="Fibrocapsa japonica" /LENGTH=195 /DNA_ID=CAMNT_0000948469 /DNA_START=78 /DNA_END=665 /DNA_ORIENTATION=+ /assembly_acc=CAM_ASM_000762
MKKFTCAAALVCSAALLVANVPGAAAFRSVGLPIAHQQMRTFQSSTLSMVSEGQAAPSFSLKDQSGSTITLASYKGKKDVVLFFYPKDDTPGCTKEAQAFNANLDEFQKMGAEVIGISSDADHSAFVEKYGLKMKLLSDINGAVRKQFKVPSSLFGALDGRVTYVIGKDGIVKKIYDNQFNPESHIDVVKEALKK